jgi:hypothetical protein
MALRPASRAWKLARNAAEGVVVRRDGRTHLQSEADAAVRTMFKRILVLVVGVALGVMLAFGGMRVAAAWSLFPIAICRAPPTTCGT